MNGNSNPRVTIGIPIVKGRWLKQSIDCWMRQTFLDFEIILFNDASKDDIKSIVQPYLADSRVSYFENNKSTFPNFVRNWNACLEKARGEYFVLGSDDDLFRNDYLEVMAGMLDSRQGVDVAHCRICTMDRDGNALRYTSLFPEFESQVDFVNDLYFHTRGILAPDFMYRTKGLKEVGGFADLPVAWGSDYITAARAARHGVLYTSEPLLSWRSSGSNVSTDRRMARYKRQAIVQYNKEWERIIWGLRPRNNAENEITAICKKLFDSRRGDVALTGLIDEKFSTAILGGVGLYRGGNISFVRLLKFLLRKALSR